MTRRDFWLASRQYERETGFFFVGTVFIYLVSLLLFVLACGDGIQVFLDKYLGDDSSGGVHVLILFGGGAVPAAGLFFLAHRYLRRSPRLTCDACGSTLMGDDTSKRVILWSTCPQCDHQVLDELGPANDPDWRDAQRAEARKFMRFVIVAWLAATPVMVALLVWLKTNTPRMPWAAVVVFPLLATLPMIGLNYWAFRSSLARLQMRPGRTSNGHSSSHIANSGSPDLASDRQ